jgi:S1-C subfamily serine protease
MSAKILPFERQLQDALYHLHAIVPNTAITADLLGTERHSHAIQISADGLLLTVGYSVMEAESLWLTNRKGASCTAILLAQDHESGIALLKAISPMSSFHLQLALDSEVSEMDKLFIIASDQKESQVVTLIAKQEFAGRWEYLLETAYYTLPLFERWSGAALVTSDGKLCGIGSLALGIRSLLHSSNPQKGQNAGIEPGNLFIPVASIASHIEHLRDHGKRPGNPRPWLGALVEEYDAELHVVGIYHQAPAALAGLKPGDVILSVAKQPVSTMSGFYRTLWHYGNAGMSIPLTVSDGNKQREVLLQSTDRESFFLEHNQSNIN